MAAVWFQGSGVDSDFGVVIREDDHSYAKLCRSVSLIQRQMQFMTYLVDEVIKSHPSDTSSQNLPQALDAVRRYVDSCGLTLPQKDEAAGYLKKHAVAAYSPIQRVISATNLDDHAAQEIQRMRTDDLIHLRME